VTSAVQTAYNALSGAISAAAAVINSALSSLSSWVQTSIKAVSDLITTKITDFVTWVNSIPIAVSAYVGGIVLEIQKWTTQTITTMVGAMFEWAKPIIKPIQDAVAFLGNISNLVMGTYPKDETLEKVQKKERDAREQLRLLFERK
jgi:phage-related protein